MTSLQTVTRPAELAIVPLIDLLYVDREWSRGHAHHAFAAGPPTGQIDFGVLGLFALETIDAGHGFAMHAHDNVEVITLIASGRGIHRDSLGNEVEQDADTVAVMSAGRGLRHAEYASEDGPARVMQIWISPQTRDTEPRAARASCPRAERANRFRVLVSGRAGWRAPLAIDQDVALVAAVLERGARVHYQVEPGRRGYFVSTAASIRVNGLCAEAGERVLVRSAGVLEITASDATEIVGLDLP